LDLGLRSYSGSREAEDALEGCLLLGGQTALVPEGVMLLGGTLYIPGDARQRGYFVRVRVFGNYE